MIGRGGTRVFADMDHSRRLPHGADPAEQARTALHRLRTDLGAGHYDAPDDVYRVLGRLSLLADELSHLLPAIRDRLEQGLLDGRIRGTGPGAALQDPWDSVAAAGHSLMIAHFTGFLAGQELAAAQHAVRDLAAADVSPRAHRAIRTAARTEGATMPQQAWNKKRERQYEHIKNAQEDRGASDDRAAEIAARTVNKNRARSGESSRASKTSLRDKSPQQRGGHRSGKRLGPGGPTRDQLYNEARKRNIRGRSTMTKQELAKALGRE